MRIRYQNGTAIECIPLSLTDQTIRVAVEDGDDVMTLTNIHGTWVSEDCEPVTMEVGMVARRTQLGSGDEYVCPPGK